jgi:hypothetical protein
MSDSLFSSPAFDVGIEIYREKKPIGIEAIMERVRDQYKEAVPKAVEELAKLKAVEYDKRSGSYHISKDYEDFFKVASEKVEEFDMMARNNSIRRTAKIERERLGIRCEEATPGMDLLIKIGREQLAQAKIKYGKNYKKVPLSEIFDF